MTEDAYRQFEEWLQKQPYWIQDAAGEEAVEITIGGNYETAYLG